MSPLQSIPAPVRSVLYLGLALVGLFLGGCQVVGVESLWGLTTVKALALLAYVSTAFGFTAAANVSTSNTVAVTAPATLEVIEADDDLGEPELHAADLADLSDDDHAGD